MNPQEKWDHSPKNRSKGEGGRILIRNFFKNETRRRELFQIRERNDNKTAQEPVTNGEGLLINQGP